MKLYYASRDFTEGLSDVKVRIKNSNGILVVTDEFLTELEKGIYYYSWTPSSLGVFIAQINSNTLPFLGLKTINIADGIQETEWVSTTYRVFYQSKNNISGLVDVKISAWKESSKIVDEEVMTESNTPGIYYHDLDLDSHGSYVVKIDSASNPRPWAKSYYFKALDIEERFVYTEIDGVTRTLTSLRGTLE